MLKAAVVGTGFISTKHHLPAWVRLRKDVQLVAVCDTDASAAAAAADRFGVPSSYTDLTELLDKEQPDFVDICTPPDSHADIATLALEADASVLIEKPLADNLQDCERIVAAESSSDRKSVV